MNNNLSIILPVFNEQDTIKSLIQDISFQVSKYIPDFEIIVVEDGSTDQTSYILRELQGSIPSLKILTHDKNKGYGQAIKTGIGGANKEWLLIMDSDGQFHISALESFWSQREKFDFILGYREKRTDNLYRSLLGKTGNFFSNTLLKKKITDINCGFKLFKSQDLKSLNLISTGGIINFEILHRLFKNKVYKFKQSPVKHFPRKYGKQTGGNWRTIMKIITEGYLVIIRE